MDRRRNACIHLNLCGVRRRASCQMKVCMRDTPNASDTPNGNQTPTLSFAAWAAYECPASHDGAPGDLVSSRARLSFQGLKRHMAGRLLLRRPKRGMEPPTGGVGRPQAAASGPRFLLLPLVMPLMMMPVSARTSCTNTCRDKFDNICSDGGPGSEYGSCMLGSDCADCGPRAWVVGAPCSWSCSAEFVRCIRWWGGNYASCRHDLDAGVPSALEVGCVPQCEDTYQMQALNPDYNRRMPPPPSPSPPPPLPPPPIPGVCDNLCTHASDGECDDGGSGAHYTFCPRGTDCADCGVRPPPTCASSCAAGYACGLCLNPVRCADVDGLISHDLIRKCHDAQPGQLCEGDGLCGTNNHMNNCHGIWDVYIRELPCAAPPPPPPSPTPPPNLILCKNLCYYTSDGDCDGAQRSHAYIYSCLVSSCFPS